MYSNCPIRSIDDTLVEKTVRLEREGTQHNELIKVYFQYLPRTREINFSKAIRQLIAHGFPLDNSQMFYYDYNDKIFVYIGTFPNKQEIFLKYENFQEKTIHLRYRVIHRMGSDRERQEMMAANGHYHKERQTMGRDMHHHHHSLSCYYSREQNSTKMEIQGERLPPCTCTSRGPVRTSAPGPVPQKVIQKRVKERSIKEVIERVFHWRKLYETTDHNGKRIHTLETAAREVGIAKKTLDDYYLQLKLGQKHKFDFQKNNDAKVGVLRAFVKECQSGIKKEPYNLKLFEGLNLAIAGNESSNSNKNNTNKISDNQTPYYPAPVSHTTDFSVNHSFGQGGASSDQEECRNYLFHHDDSFEV